jgi:RNA polymerase sigma-70 factor (ECF subfamily)
MIDKKILAGRFAADRGHLRGVAYRMLGSLPEAEDAVQEAWLRLDRADAADIDNLTGWLTTVVARVCLDMLRSRKSRAEEPWETAAPTATASSDPEGEMLLAESIGLAVLVVLQALGPAERIAFVLHDMFDLPFDEIGSIVGRTPEAARQLASRARRRVRGTSAAPEVDLAGQRAVVEAFLAAARGNDMARLLAILDPDVTFTADLGPTRALQGADAVAQAFAGRAEGARLALIDGRFGAMVVPNGRLLLVLRLTLTEGRITAVEAISNRGRLAQMELAAPA